MEDKKQEDEIGRSLHLYKVFSSTRNICPGSDQHEQPLNKTVWQSEHVRYHVYHTAVYDVCQSQYVYMMTLGSGAWSSKITGGSPCEHLGSVLQRESNNNPLYDVFHMLPMTLSHFFLTILSFIRCAGSWARRREKREKETRVKESEWERGKSESWS